MTYFRRLALLTLALGAPAQASGFEDLAALEARVGASLGAEIGEAGGLAQPIDRRLKLRACPEPALVETPVSGNATLRCASLGWRLRLPLVRPAGEAAETRAAAKAEPIIRKGDQVELRASSDAFTVAVIAVAEQDGAPGERIRVRSDRKKAVMIGIVMEDGTVSLPGFK